MQVHKRSSTNSDVEPLIAALSYVVVLDDGNDEVEKPAYDAASQRTIYAGKNSSTCHVSESVATIWNSKGDTKRDD